MLSRTLLFILCLLPVLTLNAQTPDSLNRDASPIGGINALILTYVKINFTKEQRTQLAETELEFIYSISEKGKPTLEKIHGISDPVILDSLEAASQHIPDFYPSMEQGQPVPSISTLVIRFPSYKQVGEPFPNGIPASYKAYQWEDFEYIHETGEGLFVHWGALGNGFVGNAARHLRPGGGMRLDMSYVGKKGFGGGVMMRFYGNALYNPYPLNSSRVQNSAPPTLLVGFGVIKRFYTRQRSDLSVQLEFNSAVQNVSPRLSDTDEDFLQLSGFSPGILVNYGLQIGKNKMTYTYGSPSVYRHYAIFSAAARPLFFGFQEAGGVMFEIGISYRFSIFIVDEYRLKPGK